MCRPGVVELFRSVSFSGSTSLPSPSLSLSKLRRPRHLIKIFYGFLGQSREPTTLSLFFLCSNFSISLFPSHVTHVHFYISHHREGEKGSKTSRNSRCFFACDIFALPLSKLAIRAEILSEHRRCAMMNPASREFAMTAAFLIISRFRSPRSVVSSRLSLRRLDRSPTRGPCQSVI